MALDTRTTGHRSVLYGLRHSELVRVYARQCSDCHKQVGYDGHGAGVVNWSDESLFCEEVFREFWHSFFLQRQRTVHACWKAIRQAYERSVVGATAFVSRKLFTTTMYSFLGLLDIKHYTAFRCTICDMLPDRERTVVLDGLMMGYMGNLRRAREVQLATQGEDQDAAIDV